ncbi:MAG: hypothetical protein IJZ20_07785 [Clostridia bacterium]|nr:hypothetical protein [Clostridia bacterium]
MKITTKISRLAFAVFTVLAAALAFFRFSMLSGGVVDALGLYTDKALGNLFTSLVFILIALTVVFAFLLSKGAPAEKQPNALWTASSVICMLLLLSAGISSVAELFGRKESVLSAYGALPASFDILLAVETVLLFVSVVYFLTETVKGAKKSGNSGGILALFPVVYLAIRTIRLFMNIETQINSSARSFTLLFLVTTMMFFLYEAEYRVPLGILEKTGEANTKRAARYWGFGTVAVELAIIFVLVPVFSGRLTAHELAYSLSDISLALFAAVRVLSVKTV